MADFRKWFLAFAVLALFTSVASAQIQQQFVCGTNNAGVPPTVRAEGLTELVGDLVLNCTGGIPTALNAPVPQANVTIFLSTTVTSRLLDSNNTSEALLLIDEPHSASNPAVPLQLCNAVGTGGASCQVLGTGNGNGTYNGATGRYNVFEGRLTGTNQITFFGVPIDPPGTSGTRVIRITNVRGDASRLGVSSTLVPTQVTMYVSITASTSVPVNNPQQTVAYVAPGLTTSVPSGTVSFAQCNDHNKNTAGDSSKGFTLTAPDFTFRFTEGFGSSWKVRNISEVITAGTSTANTYWSQGADANQNVPGAIYNTEAGFQNSSVSPGDPSPNPPVGPGPTTSVNDGTWSSAIGSATQGTRLMLTFNGVPTGSQVWVPVSIALANPIGGSLYSPGLAILTSTDGAGGGAFSAVTSPNSSGYAPVSTSSNTGMAVYEIVKSDPFSIETLTVGVEVVFAANVANNLPAPGVQSSVTGSFAPLSTVNVASTSAPIPRFVPGQTPRNTFMINRCSCNILFPFVTNQQGFDTGVAIANTSADTINGVSPQTGTVTLSYYSGGTPPPNQTTTSAVPGGQILTFTLSGGGNFGIAATPGFQGYIIAQAAFQYCHAFAYISAQGALPTAAGASEGYLGIILDAPGIWRTSQIGENSAH